MMGAFLFVWAGYKPDFYLQLIPIHLYSSSLSDLDIRRGVVPYTLENALALFVHGRSTI